MGKPIKANNLLISNRIITLTTLFKKELYFKYCNEIKPLSKNWKMGAYPIWLWFFFNSNIHFMPEATAVYRLKGESASHSCDKENVDKFKWNSTEIAFYFLNKYSDQEEASKVKEARFLFHYLYSIKNRLINKNNYLAELKTLKKLKLKTKALIFLLDTLRLDFLFTKLIKL